MDDPLLGASAGPSPDATPAISETLYRAIVLGAAGVLAVALSLVQFCGDVTLPDKPPRPAVSEVSVSDVTREVSANPITYRGFLESDSERFEVEPAATAESMGALLEYRWDEERHKLGPRSAPVEMAGLKLSLSTRRAKGEPHKLMVLTVENTTDEHLAYRVLTRPTSGTRVCLRKRDLGHNAMALAPGERVQRSECTYRKGWQIEIMRAETLALSPLSYHYVSRVSPEAVGVDSRHGRGHEPPRGPMCQVILPAKTRTQLETGQVTWRDLIDFYARHRCDTYRFPDDYRAFSRDGEQDLPVMP